jgi:hypothetical protein
MRGVLLVMLVGLDWGEVCCGRRRTEILGGKMRDLMCKTQNKAAQPKYSEF